jgi:hypothetical protein
MKSFTLWEIMNTFDVHQFTLIVSRLLYWESNCQIGKRNNGVFSQEDYEEMCNEIKSWKNLFNVHKHKEFTLKVDMTLLRLLKLNLSTDLSAIGTELRCIHDAILISMRTHTFLAVDQHLNSYINNELLFGKIVLDKFPRAKTDIIEAGNCLAADCNTAAIFHLMRVVEHGPSGISQANQSPINRQEKTIAN